MRPFFLSADAYEKMRERFARFNEPWTPDEEEELRALATEKVPRDEMAAQLQRTPNSIRMKLKSMGLYEPKPAGRPWTEADDDTLVNRFLEGATFAQLAKDLGRSENAIVSRLVHLRNRVFPSACEKPEPIDLSMNAWSVDLPKESGTMDRSTAPKMTDLSKESGTEDLSKEPGMGLSTESKTADLSKEPETSDLSNEPIDLSTEPETTGRSKEPGTTDRSTEPVDLSTEPETGLPF